MVETKDKKIDGKEITVTQFPAFEGLRIKTRLIKIVGPALGSLIGEGTGRGDLMSRDVNLDKAIEALVQTLDEEETPILIERLLKSTRIGGREITRDVFNMEFAGNYALLYKILAFVIETNHFFDFLTTGSFADRFATITRQKDSTPSLTKA